MKKFKILAIILVILCLVLAFVGCSPKHNEKATVEALKTITEQFTRDQVIDLLGEPLAYDSEKEDWEKHGYDFMVYSPDDLQILEWYKGRGNVTDNLPGFTSRLHWSNSEWERKYYTGVGKTDMAQISYIYMSVKFEDRKITAINALQFTQGKIGHSEIYTVTFLPSPSQE